LIVVDVSDAASRAPPAGDESIKPNVSSGSEPESSKMPTEIVRSLASPSAQLNVPDAASKSTPETASPSRVA
jgi:hypothetical protein